MYVSMRRQFMCTPPSTTVPWIVTTFSSTDEEEIPLVSLSGTLSSDVEGFSRVSVRLRRKKSPPHFLKTSYCFDKKNHTRVTRDLFSTSFRYSSVPKTTLFSLTMRFGEVVMIFKKTWNYVKSDSGTCRFFLPPCKVLCHPLNSFLGRNVFSDLHVSPLDQSVSYSDLDLQEGLYVWDLVSRTEPL